jgi:hypothetical protein
MRTHLLLLLSFTSCFRLEIAGGALSCPNLICPNGLTCENGIDSPLSSPKDGFCAAPEGEPCITNLGCTPTVECPLDANNLGLPCELGVICIDTASLQGVPSFQQGENLGICLPRQELSLGDPCTPFDVTTRCELNTGCTVNNVCGSRAGETGDSCDNAIAINGPTQVLLDVAGLANNSESAICASGAGGDAFIRYVVQGQGAVPVNVTFNSNNNGTLSDTILYAGTGCDPVDPAKITGELGCEDDTNSAFNDFASTLTIANQIAGTELFLVVDSFDVDREGLVELSITEE